MSYLQILHTAKDLAIKNPIFWLFGLALYGGFNLYLVNFFALLQNREWETWQKFFFGTFNGSMQGYFLLILAGLVIFVALNAIKILFIVSVHAELHNSEESKCDLCLRIESQNLPYLSWLKNIVLTSSVTVVFTSGIALSSGSIIAKYVHTDTSIILFNVLFVTLVSCLVGIWNILTSFFILLHGLDFSKGSKAAINLMILKTRTVLEFVIILSVLYSVTVYIGNSFIHVWQNGMMGMDDFGIRIIALALFVIWFSFNNVFFNIAFLVFFDELVKTIGLPKSLKDGQLQPNVLN